MNKKVLKVMIALVMIFLTGLYVLKIFFPEQFVMAIQNEKLIMIGEFVDDNLWLHMILGTITSFVTYWLYLCAVSKRWNLRWFENLLVLIICVATQFFYYYVDSNLGSWISIFAMILLPLISNCELKSVATVFSVHGISQLLSTQIRNLPTLLFNVNYLTIFLMTIECYFWLLLFYFYFNYKKEL